MYKIVLNSDELELVLSALRYTTENGYTFAHDTDWKEGVEEQMALYRVYDKLIEERNKV